MPRLTSSSASREVCTCRLAVDVCPRWLASASMDWHIGSSPTSLTSGMLVRKDIGFWRRARTARSQMSVLTAKYSGPLTSTELVSSGCGCA